MWIRSQNLFTLVKCERLFARQCASDSFCVIEAGVITLGSYSTLDKALKVLDQIQDAIEDTDYYRIDNIGHGTYVLANGVQVYQMPADDEVEV